MPEGRLKLLSKWRVVATNVATVIKELYPDAEIYVFGGAAEDRLTVLSDIDIAVVLEDTPKDRAGMLAKIWEILEAKGIPQYYPLEIHILSKREFERLRGVKIKLA
ncbi:MAG: DNA polymerase III subunit beta [Thermoprotei archaeon]|nr:MAG: DNA polymerase III subunit beta [Thermoprotei archaeon]